MHRLTRPIATPAGATASPNAFINNPKPTATLPSSPSTGNRLPIPLRQPHWRAATSSAGAAAERSVPISVVYEEDEEEDAGDFIRRLQNGPDVRGVAIAGEKGREVDLTPAAVEAIAQCFGEWVAERKAGSSKSVVRVSVGRDPRISGPRLGAAVFAGLRKAGCEVFDIGLATTPACFMSTVLLPFDYDASVMTMVRSDCGESAVPPAGETASPEITRILMELTRLVGMQQQVQASTGSPGSVPSPSSGVGGHRQQIPYTMTLTTTFGEPFQTALKVEMVNKDLRKDSTGSKGKKRRTTTKTVVAEKTTVRPADAKRQRWNGQRRPDSGGYQGNRIIKCHHCGKTGHILKNCRSAWATCYRCLQKGHYANSCPNPRAEATTSGTKAVDKGKAKVNDITEA